MISNGFKRKNVPTEYLKAKKKAKKSGQTIPEPDDLDWAYCYDNDTLGTISKTTIFHPFVRFNI